MVGKIFTEHRATFAQLDMKKILKVVGRFIHNDAAGMKRIFDKAEAKKKAGEAVARAIQSLSAGGKTPPSPGLQFFHSIIAEVRVPPADLANRRMRAQLVDVRDRRNAQEMYTVAKENFEANPEIDEVGADTQARLGDPLFRVALLDAAWKESVGKGKLGILLKNEEGGARDGTRALKSDLRKLAETGSWDKLQKAASLAHALDTVKTAQGFEPADEKQALRDIICHMHGKFGIDFPQQLDSTAMSDQYGKALTDLLHPGPAPALAAATAATARRVEAFLNHENVFHVFKEFFHVFSSEDVWADEKIKNSLHQFYSLALSIAALETLGEKTKVTMHDIASLKNILKSGKTPTGGKIPAAILIHDHEAFEEQKRILENFDKIKLDAPAKDVVFEMSKVIAKYYINIKVINIDPGKAVTWKRDVAAARDVAGVVVALKQTFGDALKRAEMDSFNFFQPLHSRADILSKLPTT